MGQIRQGNRPITKEEVKKMKPGVLYKTIYANRESRRADMRTSTNNRKSTLGRPVQMVQRHDDDGVAMPGRFKFINHAF